MDAHLGPARTGAVQVAPPSDELMKTLCAGPSLSVAGSATEKSWYSMSTVPSGSTSSGALSAPLAGKPGLIAIIGPQVSPKLVDFCSTMLRSPALNPQPPPCLVQM